MGSDSGGVAAPSLAARIAAQFVMAFSAIGGDDRIDGEGIWSAAEGGDALWYPNAGTWVPAPVPRLLRWAGRGSGIPGVLEQRDGRLRFAPTGYWRRRGVPDWSWEQTTATADGRWLSVRRADGAVALFRTRARP